MLQLRDLETAYGRSQVLFGVSLEVGQGEVVSLLGRNGVGRSTTVKAIMHIGRGDKLDLLARQVEGFAGRRGRD